MSEREASPSSAVHGRAPPPRVALADRGVAIGLRWSGIEGAGKPDPRREARVRPGAGAARAALAAVRPTRPAAATS